jgi:hypothetical protein
LVCKVRQLIHTTPPKFEDEDDDEYENEEFSLDQLVGVFFWRIA